jgi:hypothetical protein
MRAWTDISGINVIFNSTDAATIGQDGGELECALTGWPGITVGLHIASSEIVEAAGKCDAPGFHIHATPPTGGKQGRSRYDIYLSLTHYTKLTRPLRESFIPNTFCCRSFYDRITILYDPDARSVPS